MIIGFLNLFPMIDLPLPLAVLGGALLAVWSNRRDLVKHSSALMSEVTGREDLLSQTELGQRGEQQRKQGAIVPPILRDTDRVSKPSGSSSVGASSVNLPSLVRGGDRPISPKIDSQGKDSSQTGTSASRVKDSEVSQASKHPNPNLPKFIRSSSSDKRDRISFTIPTQE